MTSDARAGTQAEPDESKETAADDGVPAAAKTPVAGTPAASMGDYNLDRLERLRALLTAPIRIPESATAAAAEPAADGDDDYAAPVVEEAPVTGAVPVAPGTGAARVAPADASATSAKPAERSAERPATGATPRVSGSRNRRTWSDAFLERPVRALTAEELRDELAARLDAAEAATADVRTEALADVGALRDQVEVNETLVAELSDLLDSARVDAETARADAERSRSLALAAGRSATRSTVLAVVALLISLAGAAAGALLPL
ncbi:hypothetical protein L1785_07715 [Antribacter sp. KLBMP9083]|uniref:Uncharacterized protein n=1 Tax=Antribacter soli TaxID=2910976 RepID=A0AA41QEZ3_9MICO|nr:hypothetical protein [Antribacter soli]MCF4120864.1 hypothetical protein [Antribacter soli]